ncbi:hypothetical protein VVT58_05655 [Sphingobium sp. SJ10-10]|uniref:hypothetical protein n=1 Tax=Sphingobium sp. SJ10-10 TaxID=3114999 RepID=UPI002E18CA47|nr:hypothetical protein [Sphingobium sp. SJ10-10]
MNAIDEYIFVALAKMSIRQDQLAQSYQFKPEVEQVLSSLFVKALRAYGVDPEPKIPDLAKKLFEDLYEYGAIEKNSDPVAGDYYRLSYEKYVGWKKYYLANSGVAKRSSIIGPRFLRDAFNAHYNGPSVHESVEDEVVSEVPNIPASDRLVTVAHNSPEYEDLVQRTESASEAIRSSNSIDEEERGWIRTHISAGLEFIKNRKVLAGAVSALLLEPLLSAYDSVAEEPAKQAILTAIQAVRSFFGF